MILNSVLRFCHVQGAVYWYLLTFSGETKHFCYWLALFIGLDK